MLNYPLIQSFYEADSPLAYQTLPTTASFDYDVSRPVLDAPVVSLQPQPQPQLASTPVTPDQATLFACDDALMAQYLATYPPLQPDRVMALQPPANREMIYPGTSQTMKYDNTPESSRNMAGLGIQDQPQMINSAVGPNTMSSPYPPEDTSPSFSRDGGFMRLQRYSSLQGFEVKDDPDGLDMHGRSATFDLFPHQRTLPARRGPFKDHGQREKTARTRKIGSCIRCRMQRIRVSDPSGYWPTQPM